jgi:hypothetical protein
MNRDRDQLPFEPAIAVVRTPCSENSARRWRVPANEAERQPQVRCEFTAGSLRHAGLNDPYCPPGRRRNRGIAMPGLTEHGRSPAGLRGG